MYIKTNGLQQFEWLIQPTKYMLLSPQMVRPPGCMYIKHMASMQQEGIKPDCCRNCCCTQTLSVTHLGPNAVSANKQVALKAPAVLAYRPHALHPHVIHLLTHM